MPVNTIPPAQMQKWVNDYSNNVGNARETRNVILNLQDVKDLILACDAHNAAHPNSNEQVNGLRLYLVRQDDYNVNGFRDKIPGKNYTQISIVAVPVINFSNNEFDDNNVQTHLGTGIDLTDAQNNFVCIYPQSPNHEHGGLCPPNCNDSLNASFTLNVS